MKIFVKQCSICPFRIYAVSNHGQMMCSLDDRVPLTNRYKSDNNFPDGCPLLVSKKCLVVLGENEQPEKENNG